MMRLDEATALLPGLAPKVFFRIGRRVAGM